MTMISLHGKRLAKKKRRVEVGLTSEYSVGGIFVDENMFTGVPGLYAAGNTSGNLFGGLVQSMAIPALTIGRAHTFGRLAAKYCASEA
mgnify:CR=1 FL=1